MRRDCECLFVVFVELRLRLLFPDREDFAFLQVFLDAAVCPLDALSAIDLLY